MTLKQIIIVDEDGSKVTIRPAGEPYEIDEVVGGKRRVEVGVDRSLSSVLKRLLWEEWGKIGAAGARLVTRMARMK